MTLLIIVLTIGAAIIACVVHVVLRDRRTSGQRAVRARPTKGAFHRGGGHQRAGLPERKWLCRPLTRQEWLSSKGSAAI